MPYVWPIVGARPGSGITTPFGGRQSRAAGFTGSLPSTNVGLDVGATQGTPIVAPADGVVVSANTGTNYGWGNSVLLQDSQGNQWRLSHMRDAPLVGGGQRVRAGQPLGVVGMTGNATGPHLDLEFKPRGGGFADPLSQEFVPMADTGRTGPTGSGSIQPGQPLWPGGPPAPSGPSGAGRRPGGPAVPGGPGAGPGGNDTQDTRQLLLAAIKDLDQQIARTDPEYAQYARFQDTRQQLLTSLAAYDKATTPAQRDEAQKAADFAQAAYANEKAALEREGFAISREGYASAERRNAADIASAQAIAAGRNATDITQTGMTTGTQREIAGLQVGGSLLETQIRDATDRARLTWEQEKGRIEEALAGRRLTLEEATAAAGESRDRISALLTQQRNAIEAAGLEATQRGQDLTAGVTQRGQDIEAGVGMRGQDIGRLNQQLQSGSGLLGQAMQTAANIGGETGRTAIGALPSIAPRGMGQYVSDLLAGRPATAPGPMAMPFNPLTVVQQAADAAYQRYAPPGQQLMQAGMGPSPAFVAPGQIGPPPRVATPFSAIGLPPAIIRPGMPTTGPLPAGGGFTAP